jgi:predicted Zn-dependent protease
MKRHRVVLLVILMLSSLSFLPSCQTVPITGRGQISLIPDDTILPMSFNQYRDFLTKHPVVEQGEQAEMVKRVGARIERAVERYFAEHGLSSRLKGYQWEFNLVEGKEANAWCMPGGKVVVYTGILPVTKDENGLAVVMGHEIAHAVANHGGERMSQGLLAELGGLALEAALAQKPRETNDLFLSAYGIGAQVGVLLPFSRLHESEADHLGLIFMAMADYDPRAAVEFWDRMAKTKHGASPPALLSTHPADAQRVENIRKLLPEAMQYYNK